MAAMLPGEFPELADENRRIWNANARWWDDRIGDGNKFQERLIEPGTERLLRVSADDVILDVGCGAGRFARRIASLGARVVAFDTSPVFIERARERTPGDARIEYHVLDAASPADMRSLEDIRFTKAVCTMALMDMPEIAPLFRALARQLPIDGTLVFSVAHPCFHSAAVERFAEVYEEESGRSAFRTGVKVMAYASGSVRKIEGIAGQPEPQFFFHRPLATLLRAGFEAGFVLDGLEEPIFQETGVATAGVRWTDMPDVPPVLIARVRLLSKTA